LIIEIACSTQQKEEEEKEKEEEEEAYFCFRAIARHPTLFCVEFHSDGQLFCSKAYL